MLYGDLRELKALLEIDQDDLSQDKVINFLLEQASGWIDELLGRPGNAYASRVEYYQGTGTSKLMLRSRPVFATPTILVSVDEAGFYGAPSGSFASNTALTYGDDFFLKADQADGSSRSGILVRRNALWPKPQVRQIGLLSPHVGEDFGSVKVTYTGGWSVDTLPSSIRLACNLLVTRLKYLFPLGAELSGEGFEERSISVVTSDKHKLLALVMPLLWGHRSWQW